MLIFDFDGVLLNSIDEALITAYNAFTGELKLSLDEIPVGLVQIFRKNRFHFQPAGDALPLMEWCLANHEFNPEKILSRNEYSELLLHEKTPVRDRTARFFAARKRYFDTDIKRWHTLNSIYQPLWDFLSTYKHHEVLILTNKNREATLAACHHHGWKISAENVYSGDGGVNKIDNFAKIQARFPQPAKYFIDDSISNLRELHEAVNRPQQQLGLILARWGYLGPGDVESASQEGFSVFSQQEVIDFLERSAMQANC